MPRDEDARLAALRSYRLPAEARTPLFDRITWLASMLCGAPISVLCVTCEDEPRCVGRVGCGSPRELSLWAHVVATGQVLTVRDTAADPRLRDDPEVTGEPRFRFYAGVPLVDEDGSVLGALSVVDREPRELGADQLEGLALLGELAVGQLTRRRARRAVTELQQRIAAAGRREGEFLSYMAHEVRTPITVIQGYLELLGEESDRAQLAPLIERVRRNGDRLVRLIDDLEAASAARRAADSRPGASLVDVAAVVTTVVGSRRSAASRAGIELALATDGPALVRVDECDVSRVAANLIDNAIAFTPRGGHVQVRVAGRAGVTIEVSDSGVGMDADEQRHLFERFFRGAYAREQAIGGLGLGLSVVKAIVDAHSGSVTLESAPQQGTTVLVSFSPAGDPGV